MAAWVESVLEYLKAYVSQYSFFLSGDYYLDLVSKYFSLEGFIIGFIFVLLVYFSSAEEQKKAGFFKVLPLIAVINSCMVLFTGLNAWIGDDGYRYAPGMLGVPDNIVSGFVLTLVVTSCYKAYKGHAFILGIVTYAAIPMISFEFVGYFTLDAIVQMMIRIFMAGSVCLIMSSRKYFYTSWIWYFVFHILTRTLVFLTPMFHYWLESREINMTGYDLPVVLDYFRSFRTDYILFGVVLIFAIIFERAVIPVKTESSTTA